VHRRLASYFSKDAERLGAESTAESVGWEMTGGMGKRGRWESVAPMQLLDLALAGSPAAVDLWGEYELGMEGRRTVGWSRGLRDLLGIGAEVDDEAVAAEEAGTEADAAESPMDVIDWLMERGVPCMFGAVPYDWGGLDGA
jgi:hypothetical protein